MKKYLALILSVVLFVTLAVAVSAVDVYVKDGGVGDGASAETPMGSLEDAIASIADVGGTVHIVDTYSNEGPFTEPEHSAPITVTGGEFIFKTSSNRWFLNGETTFENITITAEVPKNGLVIVAQFNPIVMGEGVTVPCGINEETGDSVKTYLLGGHQLDKMATDTEALMAEKGWPLDKNSHITIKSGEYHVVSGYSRGKSDAVYTGDSLIDVYGGKINMLLGGPCNGSTGNNAEINIYSGEITTLYTAGDGAVRLDGNCVVNLFDGSIATLDICNIMGAGTVNVSGGTIGQAAKRVDADLQHMVDGTVTLNILEGAKVMPGVAMGFDVVNGEISAPVIPGFNDVAETTAEVVETTDVVGGEDTSNGGFNLLFVIIPVVLIAVVAVVVVIVFKRKK